MLQRLLIITLTLCSLTASAQWQQTGSKVRYVNGLGIPTKDTAAGVAADSSQIVIRPADSSLYIKYKRTWVKVGAGGGGTIGGSGTTNYVPKFTAGTTLGNSSIVDSASAVAMTINTSGNIGVGTTNAPNKFVVSNAGQSGFEVAPTGGVSSGVLLQAYNRNTLAYMAQSYYALGHTWNVGTAAATRAMDIASGGAVLINTTTDNGVDKLQVSGSMSVGSIKATGNVGIFNSSPFYALSVGDGTSTRQVVINGLNSGTNGGSSIAVQANSATTMMFGNKSNVTGGAYDGQPVFGFGGSTNSLQFYNFNTLNVPAMISSGDRFLIGTTTDNGVDKLQVSGSAIASTLKFNTSGQTVSISSYYNGGVGQNIWVGGGGLSSTSAANGNVSFGIDALKNITSGYYNTAIGGNSLYTNSSGYVNDAFGYNTLYSNTSGYRNVAFGASSLYANTTGFENMAVGHLTLQANTTGSKNVGIGAISLANNTTGSSNIAFGHNAGTFVSGGGNLTTPSQSMFIGEDTRPSANGNTNEMVFGHTAIGQGSNTVTLGNSSITKTFLRGSTMIKTTTDNNIDELQVNGSISGTGFKQNYVTKTGTYTATTDDYVIDCTSGTFTVNLPALVGRTGMVLIIKNSGTGTITVDPNGATVIDGAATYALSTQYATVQIISDGTDWKIIAKF